MTPEERKAARERCIKLEEDCALGPDDFFLDGRILSTYGIYARKALPAALDEIEKLETRVRELKDQLAEEMGVCGACISVSCSHRCQKCGKRDCNLPGGCGPYPMPD